VALSLFVGQLVSNALWSWLFFAWRRGGLAFADVILLTSLVVATALAFARVRSLAAVLLLPYLAWVMFATALTHALWRANVEQLSK
jgi:tryptophan-rich sensory protein